jgi:hypothetical protein
MSNWTLLERPRAAAATTIIIFINHAGCTYK